LDWLEASRLPAGDWARFYEMGSNRPLYMTRDYQLTYDDADLPQHYGFRGVWDVAKVRRAHREIVEQGRERYLAGLAGGLNGHTRIRPAAASRQDHVIEAIVEDLDPQGRWIDDGMINSKTFIRNYGELARFLALNRPPDGAPARAIAAIADPLGNGLHAEVFGLGRPQG
jgi:hypothetical protein